MRILFLTQILPLPLDAGPRVRAYYVLRYLAEAGHEVSLVSFVRSGESLENVRPLQEICHSVETIPLVRSQLRNLCDGLHSMFTEMPFLILRDQVAPMREMIRKLTTRRSFDAMHADQLWMAPYCLDCRGPRLKVLDQHNAVFMVPRRMAEHQPNALVKAFLRKEASKLEAFEQQTCSRFDRVVWVTKEDRKAVCSQGNAGGRGDLVIPIAVDAKAHEPVKRTEPFRVTFVGGMHWPPNLEGISWFVEQVWPKVARTEPSAILTLIGKGVSRKLHGQCSGGRIEIAGYVRDLQQYISETAVFLVPIQSGAGMRVKILDAWCWGLPVVSTTVGAEGLRTATGENLLIADDEQTFADSVIRVLQNSDVAQRLSDGGRATVEQFYDWREAYRAWDQIYQTDWNPAREQDMPSLMAETAISSGVIR